MSQATMSVDVEKLAGLIGNRWPDKWRAEFQYPGEAWENLAIWPAGNGFATIWLYPRSDDGKNASFIIWCLDRLEEIGAEDGHYPVLYRLSPNQYRVSLHDRPLCHAPTRAEVCAQALLAALTSLLESG